MRLEGPDQVKLVCLSYLMQAQKGEGVISIKSSDRAYLRQAMWNTMKEHDIDDIAVVLPEAEGELWLIKRTSPSGR